MLQSFLQKTKLITNYFLKLLALIWNVYKFLRIH